MRIRKFLALFLLFISITAHSVTATEVSFSSGALVIPMHTTYQDSLDGGLLEAYGLVFELLDNGISVYWVIDDTKTSLTAPDMTITDSNSNPVASYYNHDGTTTSIAGITTSISYSGGPFVIAYNDETAFKNILSSATSNWSAVDVHKINAPFSVNVYRQLTGTPPKIALMNSVEDKTKGNAAILESYLRLAGICSSAYTVVTPNEIRDGALATGGYDLLWTPHWTGYENHPSDVETIVSKVSDFLDAGKSMFAECASIDVFEHSTNGKFLSTNGLGHNGIDNPPTGGSTVYNDKTSPFSQIGDLSFVPSGGVLHNWRPYTTDDPYNYSVSPITPPESSYNSDVTRFTHYDGDGNNSTANDNWDFFVGGRKDGDLNKGYVLYLAGHKYASCSAGKGAGEGNETPGIHELEFEFENNFTSASYELKFKFKKYITDEIITIDFNYTMGSTTGTVSATVSQSSYKFKTGTPLEIDFTSMNFKNTKLENIYLNNVSSPGETITLDSIVVSWVNGASDQNIQHITRMDTTPDVKIWNSNEVSGTFLDTTDFDLSSSDADEYSFTFHYTDGSINAQNQSSYSHTFNTGDPFEVDFSNAVFSGNKIKNVFISNVSSYDLVFSSLDLSWTSSDSSQKIKNITDKSIDTVIWNSSTHSTNDMINDNNDHSDSSSSDCVDNSSSDDHDDNSSDDSSDDHGDSSTDDSSDSSDDHDDSSNDSDSSKSYSSDDSSNDHDDSSTDDSSDDHDDSSTDDSSDSSDDHDDSSSDNSRDCVDNSSSDDHDDSSDNSDSSKSYSSDDSSDDHDDSSTDDSSDDSSDDHDDSSTDDSSDSSDDHDDSSSDGSNDDSSNDNSSDHSDGSSSSNNNSNLDITDVTLLGSTSISNPAEVSCTDNSDCTAANVAGVRYVLNTLFNLQFTVTNNEFIRSTPVVSDGVLYQGTFEYPSYAGHLKAIQVSDETKLWDAADNIPSDGYRTIFTYINGVKQDFTAANIDALRSSLDVTPTNGDDSDEIDVIQRVRGLIKSGTSWVDTSTNKLGGIEHSAPAIVGPNDLIDPNRKTVVYVGDLFGMLHAFDAGDNGKELWAFIPENVLGKLKNDRTDPNSQNDYAAVDASPTIRDVFIDHDGNGTSTWRTVITCGEGDGGNSLFALDITNPDSPTILWEKTDTGTGSGHLSGMGSVSRTTISKVKGSIKYSVITSTNYAGNSNPNGGIHIYSYDLLSGDLNWQFSADYSSTINDIPGAIGAYDLDNDSFSDRIVAGDMDGRLWELDVLTGTNPNGADTNASDNKVYLKNSSTNNVLVEKTSTSNLPLYNAGIGKPISASPSIVKIGDKIVIVFGTGGADWADNTGSYAVYAVDATDASKSTSSQYSTGAGSAIFTINLAEGEKVWSSPTIAAGQLYFATAFGTLEGATPNDYVLSASSTTNTGNLYAYDITATSATSSWTMTNIGQVRSSIFVSDEHIFASTIGGSTLRVGSGKNDNPLSGGQVRPILWKDPDQLD